MRSEKVRNIELSLLYCLKVQVKAIQGINSKHIINAKNVLLKMRHKDYVVLNCGVKFFGRAVIMSR